MIGRWLVGAHHLPVTVEEYLEEMQRDEVGIGFADDYVLGVAAEHGNEAFVAHHPSAVHVGGGIKAGVHHAATDEFGYKAVEDKVHVNDLHATLLHLLGLDHEKLTYRHNGRDYRLTDLGGRVIHEILA